MFLGFFFYPFYKQKSKKFFSVIQGKDETILTTHIKYRESLFMVLLAQAVFVC